MAQHPPLRMGGGREISVIIPAYNEAARIAGSLGRVIAYLTPRWEAFEVIVVDDGSTDSTAEEVKRAAHPALRCLRNRVNSGKGFSVRRGVLEARHDPVLFTDADLSTPLEELERLVEALSRGFDVAIASRAPDPSRVKRSVPRRILGWGFGLLVSRLAVPGFLDTQCGFKLFRREAATEIFPLQTIDGWGFDVEVLAIALRRGFRVAEVPVSWAQSEKSQVSWATPFSMAGELLEIRRNLKRGLYGPQVRARERLALHAPEGGPAAQEAARAATPNQSDAPDRADSLYGIGTNLPPRDPAGPP